jgi:hypothetical protein
VGEYPNALTDDEQTEECDAYQQPEKVMVVLPSDAVIKIYAMMIESLRASFTCIAMIAGNVNCLLTFLTVLQLFFIIIFFDSEKKIVSWVTYRYLKKIKDYHYEKSIDGCEHYP